MPYVGGENIPGRGINQLDSATNTQGDSAGLQAVLAQLRARGVKNMDANAIRDIVNENARPGGDPTANGPNLGPVVLNLRNAGIEDASPMPSRGSGRTSAAPAPAMPARSFSEPQGAAQDTSAQPTTAQPGAQPGAPVPMLAPGSEGGIVPQPGGGPGLGAGIAAGMSLPAILYGAYRSLFGGGGVTPPTGTPPVSGTPQLGGPETPKLLSGPTTPQVGGPQPNPAVGGPEPGAPRLPAPGERPAIPLPAVPTGNPPVPLPDQRIPPAPPSGPGFSSEYGPLDAPPPSASSAAIDKAVAPRAGEPTVAPRAKAPRVRPPRIVVPHL